MSVDVVTLLRELDVRIDGGPSPLTWSLRMPDHFWIEVAPVAPVERVNIHLAQKARGTGGVPPLIVGRSATAGVHKAAREGTYNLLTEEPHRLVLSGSVYEPPAEPESTQVFREFKRPAWIRWAVERVLLLADEPMRQHAIADVVGSSQQTVSNAARFLGELVQDDGKGLYAPAKAALLDHWIRDYPGAGGHQFGWYGLDSPVQQVDKAVKLAELLDAEPLVSGDVAADLLAPWKLPARGRVYVTAPIDLAGEGFVPAPLDEATLVMSTPQDPTLWRLAHRPEGGSFAVADPAIVSWDILASGDVDNDQAADKLRDLIVGCRLEA